MEKRKRPQSLIKTLLRLFGYFRYIWPVIIVVILMSVFTGFAEIYGTFLQRDVINRLTGLIKDIQQGSLTTTEALQGLMTRLGLIPVIVIYSIGVFCALAHNEIMVFVSQTVLYRIRKELMEKMEKLPLSYFDTHPNGDVMSYFTNDVDSLVNALMTSFANIFIATTKIVCTIVVLFVLNVPLSLIVIVFIAFMMTFMILNTHASRKYFKAQQDALANVNAIVEEDVKGIKTVKAFSHEEESFEKFDKANTEWRKASEKAFFHTQVNTPFFVSMSYFNFALSAICGILALTTGWAGPFTYGDLTVYLVLTRNACQPFNFFVQHINNFLVAAAGAERLFGFLDQPIEQDDGYVHLVKISEEADFSRRYQWSWKEEGKVMSRPVEGRITFDHVTFSYVKGKPVLKDISFEAHPGKKTAFVGSTGAGKTTIISLLARFYPIDSGAIYYDGINIEAIDLVSLRRAISMITQDTHLFTGTIEDNIRYVRRHSSHQDVVDAAKRSHADSFIRRLPEGYDTMIYDDGNNLSAGQRQLLGLARASLNRPPVMILDEATSNIDTRSEMLIQKGLEDLMQDRTVLIIAHRLSTIRDADEIAVLDSGRIIERGTQDELLARKGAYYDLYTGKKELA